MRIEDILLYQGVDRLTSLDGGALHKISIFLTGSSYPFNQADSLWSSFQGKISNFVNNNEGSSSSIPSQIYRPDWSKVKDVLDGNAPLSTLSKNCPD